MTFSQVLLAVRYCFLAAGETASRFVAIKAEHQEQGTYWSCSFCTEASFSSSSFSSASRSSASHQNWSKSQTLKTVVNESTKTFGLLLLLHSFLSFIPGVTSLSCQGSPHVCVRLSSAFSCRSARVKACPRILSACNHRESVVTARFYGPLATEPPQHQAQSENLSAANWEAAWWCCWETCIASLQATTS